MSGARGPAWLWALAALFVLALGAVIAGAMTRRPDVPVFPHAAPEPREPPAGAAGPDTVTLDARHETAWVRFDLVRRRVAGPAEPWDIAARRHQLRWNRATPDSGRIDWYDYGFFSHVLTPRPDTLAGRTADGRAVRLRVLSYYCPGPAAGCYTLEYRLP